MQRTDSLEKILMLGKIEQEQKGTTEDEMVGWHHWVNAHEFEQTPGGSDGQAAWLAIVHRVVKSQTRLSDWTTTRMKFEHYWLSSDWQTLGCIWGKLSFGDLWKPFIFRTRNWEWHWPWCCLLHGCPGTTSSQGRCCNEEGWPNGGRLR